MAADATTSTSSPGPGTASASTGNAQAAQLKEQGNAHFKAGEFLKAAAAYTSAIKCQPDDPVLYSNRSAALLKLKKVAKALEDADKCITLSPGFSKGHFRKGAILEEQGKHAPALESYRKALEVSTDDRPDKALLQKIRALAKQLNVDSGLPAEEPAAPPKQQQQQQPAQQQAAPSAQPPQPQQQPPGDAEYEDLGSEEVAAFCEEYLKLLADEVRDHGVDWVGMVHMLPGPGSEGVTEEVQPHIRGAGAWDSPQSLEGFVNFCRACAEKLDAQAVMTLVPKPSIAFPQTWKRPSWPGSDGPGVFAQLESRDVRKCWFVPVVGVGTNSPEPGTPISVSAEAFGPMARVLKAAR